MTNGDDVPTLTYKSEGGELKGTPKLSTTATKTSPVGTYPITVSGDEAQNYTLSYTDGILNIYTGIAMINAAQAVIEYEKPYCIFTTFNGKEEGTQRYYLTTDGYLTSRPEEAGVFTFHRTEGDNLFWSPGWKLNACFTNPQLSEGATGDLGPQ